MPRNMAYHAKPSAHAREVMRARGITWPEILAVLSKPERVYNSRGQTVYQGNGLGVVLAPDAVVVTVLLKRDPETIDRNRWDDQEARDR